MSNKASARSAYKCCAETLLSIGTRYAFLLVAVSVLAVSRLVWIRLRGSVRWLRRRGLVRGLALLRVRRALLWVGRLLIGCWGVCRRVASVVWLRRVLILLVATLLLCVVRSRRILSLALLLPIWSLLAIGSLLVPTTVIVVVRHSVCTSGGDVM
jgi:hypothetical protein